MGAPSILVTGGSGFVGTHLVEALRARLPDAVLHTAPFEITDPAQVARAIADAAPTHCVHLAAVAAIGEARDAPDRAWQVNLGGTLALARALRAARPAATLVFVSSADAYGATFREVAPVDERCLLAPLNTYAATKAAADLALGAMAAEGLRVVRLRAFNHTGPGQRDSFVVAAFARQVARIEAGQQEPVLRVGALDPERDFLDVRDVVRAYAEAVARADGLEPGLVLNIASGTPRRVGDVLADLLRLAEIDASVETDRGRLRPSDIPRAIGDASRARAALDWAPAIAWERTLADVLADWRARVRAGA